MSTEHRAYEDARNGNKNHEAYRDNWRYKLHYDNEEKRVEENDKYMSDLMFGNKEQSNISDMFQKDDSISSGAEHTNNRITKEDIILFTESLVPFIKWGVIIAAFLALVVCLPYYSVVWKPWHDLKYNNHTWVSEKPLKIYSSPSEQKYIGFLSNRIPKDSLMSYIKSKDEFGKVLIEIPNQSWIKTRDNSIYLECWIDTAELKWMKGYSISTKQKMAEYSVDYYEN